METTRQNNGPLLFIIALAFAACALLMLRNGQHANANHREAPALRAVINDQAGAGNAHQRGLSLYYSELHGTLLILLRTGNGQAGGWVIKITEATAAGIAPLGPHTYERTCFVADQVYWSAVIARDKYIPLMMALSIPALAAVLAIALATVVKLLRRAGHDGLADHIEQETKR